MPIPAENTEPARPPVARRLELPWLILGALFLSTLLAAFQSARQIRAESEKRFSEIAQSEKRTASRQVEKIRERLQGVAAASGNTPNFDQNLLNSFLAGLFSNGNSAEELIALQVLPGSQNETPEKQATPVLYWNAADSRSQTQDQPWTSIPSIAASIAIVSASGKPATSEIMRNLVTAADTPIIALVVPVKSQGTSLVSNASSTVVGLIDLNLLIAAIARSSHFPVHAELLADGKTISSAIPKDAAKAEMTTTVPLEFEQQKLELRISSTPDLDTFLQNSTPRAILLTGMLSTILLASLIIVLTRLREQAEKLAASMTRKLQDQTKFTEDLIEFNPNAIFRKDANGRFVSVNRAWEHLTGLSRESILGKTYKDYQAPAVAEKQEAADRQLLASVSGYEMSEAYIANTDGREFETIIAKQVIRGTDEKIDGLIGTITDVTPIKKLERELAQGREQLNLVIRSSQQGIWDIELDKGEGAYFSGRFREILGYTEKNFPTPLDWTKVIHPDDAKLFRENMIRHFKGETPLFDVESRATKWDGSYVWVRTRAIAQRNASGRAIRFVGSIVDVTDRKLAEQELIEANSRVTEAARAKEAFLATMSHEIRTPLNGVLGMTSLLSETNLNDEQRDYIRLIGASGDTLLRLIDDVLDFTKIESGRMTLENVPLEIVPIAEDAFELVAEKAREKQLSLLFDIDDDTPYYIMGDATRLRQILLNLLSNAIKFTERGEIRLTLSSHRRSDGRLQLEGRVIDTGIGITEEGISKLFQPFTQADTSTTRKFGGTGLGLVICKRLTNLMGGDIRVESTVGQGATFIFSIITQPARGPLKPYMQRDVFDFVGLRILVVDSLVARHEILNRLYQKWGFEIIIAQPEEAAATFRAKGPFDIIITDMVLPSSEASALSRVLETEDDSRSGRQQARVSSILLSNFSRSELAQRRIVPPIRHDVFMIRPVSRGKIFDALMRAALQEKHTDIATRPYTSEPVYEKDFQSLMEGAIPPAEPRLHSEGLNFGKELKATTAPVGRQLKVLVAEDNEVNQRVVMGMLSNMGHDSTLVADGRSAVNHAIAEKFDIILMDIHMPEMDGIAAMREIRKHLVGEKCPPIVAMTAHALPGDREHYLSEGMNNYISKPIKSKDLLTLMEGIKRNGAVDVAPTTTSEVKPLPAIVAKFRKTKESPNSAIEKLPILDIEQLQDLRYLPASSGDATGNNDSVGGLIRLFQTKAGERMASMENMLEDGDWTALAETAHSLRGSSASMGFPRVAAICKDLELMSRKAAEDTPNTDTPTQEQLDSVFESIRHYHAEASAALQVWLTEESSPAG